MILRNYARCGQRSPGLNLAIVIMFHTNNYYHSYFNNNLPVEDEDPVDF